MKLDSIKLRKLREKSKLSQSDLAIQLDLSQTTICDWEKRDSDVKLEYILKLSDVLQSDISELTKDGTNLNIRHDVNSKVNNSSMLQINTESYLLQKDLINSLKKQVAFLEEEIIRLKTGN